MCTEKFKSIFHDYQNVYDGVCNCYDKNMLEYKTAIANNTIEN